MNKPAQVVMNKIFGHLDAIASLRCSPVPVGCGRQLTLEEIGTWGMRFQQEYHISGMCSACQLIAFEEVDKCSCPDPCCQADVGVGIITCGSDHCPIHGLEARLSEQQITELDFEPKDLDV